MSPLRYYLFRSLLLSLAVILFTGCAQEEWRWDWWNKDTQKTQTKPATTTSRRPVDRSQPATPAETKTAAAKESQPEDEQAIDVQDRIRRFTEGVEPKTSEPADYNDFNSKIARQQDPDRRRRISQNAQRAAAEPERQPSGHGVARVASATHQENDALETSDGNEATSEPRPVNMNPLPIEPARDTKAAPTTVAQAPAKDTSAATKEPQAQMLTGDTSASRDTTNDTNKVMANREAIANTQAKETAANKPVEATPEPPKIMEIRVAAGPETKAEDVATTNAADAPKANVPQTKTITIDTFKQKLEEQQKIVAKDPNNIAEQLRLRMMYLINKQDDKAMALDEGMDIETHAIIQAQIRSMMASREADGRDPATFANGLLESVENLRALVRAKADLSVPMVALCKRTEGFGVYEPYAPAEFPAGVRQEVLIYLEVDNFSSEITPNGFFRTLLTLRPSLLNKRTGEEIWSTTYENIEDLSRRRRSDFFLTVSQTVPASLSPGEYVLKVEVEDVLVGKINSGIAEFRMIAAN